MSHPDWSTLTVFEEEYWSQGFLVAGTDEVGRGPLAGPVVAAVVILSPTSHLRGLDDSKRLSESARLRLFGEIYRQALGIGIGGVGPRTIERVNILEASRLAMYRALTHLPRHPDVVLTDAMALPEESCPVVSLVHGDARSASIAAASVVAKVVRDAYMVQLHQTFPHYGFDRHKGYPTRLHKEALQTFGPCPAHRRTFLHDERLPSAAP